MQNIRIVRSLRDSVDQPPSSINFHVGLLHASHTVQNSLLQDISLCFSPHIWIPSKTLLPSISPFPSISHIAARIICNKHYFHHAISVCGFPWSPTSNLSGLAWLSRPSLFPTSSIIPNHRAFPDGLNILLISYCHVYTSPFPPKLPFLLSLIHFIQLYLPNTSRALMCVHPYTYILHSLCSFVLI